MVDKVEDQIRRAVEEGKFKDLPGKGKPLNLSENPFEDPEWRLANKMLKDGGFTLPWIEAQQNIDADMKTIRAELKRSWCWRQTALAGNRPYNIVQDEWEQVLVAFRKKVEQLNHRIRTYNLQAPSLQLHKKVINADREIELVSRTN